RLLSRNWKLPMSGTSLVTTAIKEDKSIVVQDTNSDPNWLPNDLLPDTRSEIVVPLRTSGQIIGALDIQHSEANTFDESAQQLFETLAEQLAVTFENVSLLDNAEERAKKLATVAEVSIEAATERDVSKMLRSASQLTRDNFDLYHAHIYLVDQDKNRMLLAAGAGEAGQGMVNAGYSIHLSNDNSVVVQAVRTQEPVIANDITQAKSFLPNPMLPNTRAELAVPMIVAGRVVGVLDVQDDKVARFDEEDSQVLQILASQLAVAVDNIRTLELAENSARELDRIFNSTIDMLGAASFEGYFVQLNDAWSDTLGWTREELMAEPFVSFVHPDDVDATLAEAGKLAEGASVVEFTNRYRKKDGEYLWISWKSVPDMESGRINFVARDITQQRDAQMRLQRTLQDVQETQKFLETVTNSTPDWIFVKDQNYRYTFVNEAYANALNLPAESFIGKDDLELGFPEEIVLGNPEKDIVGFRVDDDKVLKEGQSLRNPYDPATIADGSLIILDTSKIPLRDPSGDIIGVLGIARDVTDRNRQEREIRRRASRMEAITEISSTVSGILEVDELLQRVSDLTSDRMEHYHA
ncbi:MAG: GAF domain-containing protein, partial [Chloroflexota bacterium]